MDTSKIFALVRIVLILLVGIPAIALFGLLFRKPGYSHDNTRRWVDYTKAALVIWGSGQIAQGLQQIIYVACFHPVHGWYGNYQARDASFAFGIIGVLLETWSLIAIFLALFYLAHALTQLRCEGQEDSRAYNIGRKVALGVSGFLSVLNLVTWCLRMAVVFSRNWHETYSMIYLTANCFVLSIQGILILCAIGSIVYSAKARKKALGSPVQKAATLLVTCSSLYLIRSGWYMVTAILGFFDFLNIVDIFLGSWMTFTILTLLYLLATKEEYPLSKTQYRSKAANENQTA